MSENISPEPENILPRSSNPDANEENNNTEGNEPDPNQAQDQTQQSSATRVRALINSDPLSLNSLNNPNPVTDPSRLRSNLFEIYRGDSHRYGAVRRSGAFRNQTASFGRNSPEAENSDNFVRDQSSYDRTNLIDEANLRYKSRGGMKRSVSQKLVPKPNKFSRIRQRHSSTSSVTDDKLLTCSICKNTFKDPYMLTTCGHTFCFYCIKKAQSRDPRCPICFTEVKDVTDPSILVQNVTIDNLISQHKRSRSSSYLSDIIEPNRKVRRDERGYQMKSEFTPISPIRKNNNDETFETSNFMKQSLSLDDMALLIENNQVDTTSNSEKLQMETDENNSSICLEIPHNTQHTLNQIENLMHILEKKRQSCISNSIETTNILTLNFLDRLKKEKSHELKLLQEEVGMIERDITTVNTMLSETEKTAKNFKFEKNLKDKRAIISGRFEEIEKSYERNCLGKRVSKKLTVSVDGNPQCVDVVSSPLEKTCIETGLDGFRDNLHKTVRYTKLDCLAQFQFNPHVVQSTNIVSSIDFDRDQEYFAVGGILKKIKIYDFENIVETTGATGLGVLEHQPCYEMKTPDKISALNFSWFHKQKLAASLYDGQVQVLDASTGQKINSLREHSERCWSIDFNPHNPMHLASGADDGLVKIWDLEDRSEKSVGRIYLGQNVCAVQWSPGNQYQLAIGTVDHLIKLYDIRKTRQPLCTFSGHSKAVSYVKFLDSKSMVSLSTDSTIKQWDTGEADLGSFAHVPGGLKCSGF